MVQKKSIKNNLSHAELGKMAREVALLTLEISYGAKTGHVGSALSICDFLTVLYFSKINISKKTLASNRRDRFILSKGHAAAALYAVLFKKGILTKNELHSFGQNKGGLCEHPEIKVRGIEMSTGSLGHGLAFGIGIALGQKKMKYENKTFVLISDGECGEGSIWESALLAPRLALDNLVVFIDYNKWQCFGRSPEISNLEPLLRKWKDFGWNVRQINGHDIKELSCALEIQQQNRPTIIIGNTISGNGVSIIEDKILGHYKVFSEAEYMIARKELMKT